MFVAMVGESGTAVTVLDCGSGEGREGSGG